MQSLLARTNGLLTLTDIVGSWRSTWHPAPSDPIDRSLRGPFWTWQEADTPIQRALCIVVHSGDRSDGCSSISILGALSDFSPPNGARGTLGRLVSLHGSPAARNLHARRTACRAVADLRVLELKRTVHPLRGPSFLVARGALSSERLDAPSDFEPRAYTSSLVSKARGVRTGLKVADDQGGKGQMPGAVAQ